MRTRRVSTIAAPITVLLALAATTVMAACPPDFNCDSVGCNSMNIESTLFPDAQATIYVNLVTLCGTDVVQSCSTSFLSEPTFDSKKKCEALVNAINLGCSGLYVANTMCSVNSTLNVTDFQCNGGDIRVGLTCSPDDFNQSGSGEALCDYEGDVFTRPDGCDSDEDQGVELTFGGTAEGLPIVTSVPNMPPRAGVLINISGSGRGVETVEVLTPQGMTAKEIARDLADQVKSRFPELDVKVRNGRRILLTSDQVTVGAGCFTNDVGIKTGMFAGPRKALPAHFPLSPNSQ